MSSPSPRSGLSRRRFIAGAGGVGLALGAAAVGSVIALERARDDEDYETPANLVVPFRGTHQAGIATATQHYLQFAAFDVTSGNRADLVAMLKEWTSAADAMTKGALSSAAADSQLAPPHDTGEALGLTAARLTVTVGFGASLFSKDGMDRFGLASKLPEPLAELPVFNGDRLDPARSDGDIMVQACADDPQVAFHAIRNFARIGRGTVTMRWSQLGFSKTSVTSREQDTPRNLMGFKDGTNNIISEDTQAMDDEVWAGDGDYEWMRGGSYCVIRRIRMLIEVWDRAVLSDQEQTIGREKVSGAPLGGLEEHDTPNMELRSGAQPVIPMDAHIRLAAAAKSGERILRRGYSFADGMDSYGQLDAGLFFIAFQRDPRAQFVPIQKRLADFDALNEYIKHTASGVYAIPPGAGDGGYLGQALFEATA